MGYRLNSIEHDPDWVGRFHDEYIYAQPYNILIRILLAQNTFWTKENETYSSIIPKSRQDMADDYGGPEHMLL